MSFRILESEHFARQVQKARKTYYRKSDRGYETFLTVIQAFLIDLEENGGHCSGSATEPFPNGAAIVGWDLHKFYLRMPERKGASGEGRIIFLIDKGAKFACPIMFYTHDEFAKRPPDKDLTRLLKSAVENAVQLQKAAPQTLKCSL